MVQVLKSGRSGGVLLWDGTVHGKLQSMERYVAPYSMLALSADDEQLNAQLSMLERGAWVLASNVEVRLRQNRLEACLSSARGGRLELLAEDDARVQDLRREWAAAVCLARGLHVPASTDLVGQANVLDVDVDAVSGNMAPLNFSWAPHPQRHIQGREGREGSTCSALLSPPPL